jgi:hypothetical protein
MRGAHRVSVGAKMARGVDLRHLYLARKVNHARLHGAAHKCDGLASNRLQAPARLRGLDSPPVAHHGWDRKAKKVTAWLKTDRLGGRDNKQTGKYQ